MTVDTADETSGQVQPQPQPLELTFSHNIIEHLGLKLYQNKPTNVLAELVSNSWDADAQHVWIDLLTTDHGSPAAILVADDGSGMGEEDLLQRYLVVGLSKRENADERSAGGRTLMGRKGIGKLAPFGVAAEIDLLTVKNGRATWLRFDYAAMKSSSEESGGLSRYRPTVICRDTDLEKVDVTKANIEQESVQKFIDRIKLGGKGTLIAAKKLTLKRVITAHSLKEALGRRFTVTMARQDFNVSINEQPITEGDVFPEWEMRIPEVGLETVQIDTPIGVREVRFWAGFVKSAAWPQEQAGVGVYAHGKIGQDRPFFFGVKGNEIFSRYLFGVVEADWIDELEYDAISTDRTSINWNDDNLTSLQAWGQGAVKSWIKAYVKHRENVEDGENRIIVNDVLTRNRDLNVRESEKGHLIGLLSEVTPRMGKDSANKAKLVEATVKAWVHEPARKLIKQLWEKASHFDPDSFPNIVVQLVDQLVPESLSLAVVFAQRVFALTQLESHIMKGKETQLQELLEQFPWILDNKYERFVARRALKTICDEAASMGFNETRNVHVNAKSSATMPDFVFFASVDEKKFLVVELKSPSETAAWPEFQQLLSYMTYLQSRYPESDVDGILIARSFEGGIEKQKTQTMDFKPWQQILLQSRKDHMDLLAAMLAGTYADPGDTRVQMICELGGAPVTGFLERMGENNEEIKELMRKIGLRQKSPSIPVKQPDLSFSALIDAETDG